VSPKRRGFFRAARSDPRTAGARAWLDTGLLPRRLMLLLCEACDWR